MNALISFFLNVELLLLAVTSAEVFIDPREGSIAGGTWITLRLDDCLGLTSDQLSLWYSTNGSQLEVSLVNPTLPRVVCDVHPLHFDVSTVRCKTRSLLQEGVYHPEVTSNGQVISTSGRMTGDNCTFKFSVAQTPVVYQINPPSGVPGNLIEVYGQVIAGSYETMDFDTDYIDGPVILEAEDDGWISLCSFANKQNRSSYPIQREREMGTLKCRVEGSYIGSQNVSFSVFNKGKSVVHKDAWLISAKQELFLYQTHPEIVSVFPTSGSLGGGTRLTITGDFFDHPLKVTIAGVPCENRYISPWKIICITGPVDKTRRLSAPQPGNRGLLFEVWDDTVDTGLTEATPGYRWQFVPNASSPAGFLSQAKQPFRSRLRGFFVAPQTNNYTFWILADGKASLYLSLTEDPGSKVKIASLPAGISQWSEHWEKNWNQSWQPKSQKFELTGGSRYYLEALHHGTAPSTGMRVGIQLHNTWLNPDVINTYHREKHEIQASAHQLPEIQMLTLSGTGWFSLSWDNVSSNMISTNATADQVQAVIEELLSVKCDTEPLSAKFLFRNGFENDQKDFSTKGYVVSGVEPFCGRFSICSPKHLVRTSPPTLPRYDVTQYTHVCFAHKGYISNILHVLVSYSNAFLGTVKKNLTCHWSPQENGLESWEFTCVDLWRSCVNNSELLLDRQANSTVLVHQVVLLLPGVDEEPPGKFYLDEIIISDRQVTVFQRDPKPAHPGGNIIEAVSVVGSPPIYNVSLLVAGCGGHLPLFSLRPPEVGATWGVLPLPQKEAPGPQLQLRDRSTRWQFTFPSLPPERQENQFQVTTFRLQTRFSGTNCVVCPRTVWPERALKILTKYLKSLIQTEQDDDFFGGTLPSQGSEEDDSLFASLENANISLRVQRLQTASPPIGGTFQILLPNTVISGVPIHISSHHLHKLLQSSTDNSTAHYFNASDFTVTKDSSTCYEAIWTLTWKAKTGDLPNVISVSAENLTGLNPTVTARVVYDGGVFMGPIFGDMLATLNNSTQVVVVVNEVLANCSGSCSFRYCQEATPLVSDVEYLLDDGLHTKVFIRGSGFTADHQALRILVNDTTCNVTASNQTDLVCQMKMPPVGLYWIMLLVRPYGFALNASTGGDIYLRIEPKLVAVEPSRASEIGGCPVILRGTGFNGISLVLFGSQVCPVNTNNSNSMRIECEVPSRGEEDFNVHVTLIAGCQSTVFANVFIYDPSLNPAIVALSRNRSSIAGGQMLQIGLSSFAAYTGSDVKVQIGDTAADILGKTAHGLDVVLPGLAAGWYNISVILNDILIGSNGVEPLIQYISEIFSIEPCCGSFLGGTMLTISGIGFSPNPALVSVTIDRQTCDVTHLMEEAIWCRTPPAAGSSHVQSQDISAQVLVFIGSRSTTHTPSLSLQSRDIAFTYQMALTPGVSAVEVEMRNGSLHLGIHGLNVTNSLAKLGDSACELTSQPANESTTFSQCSLPLSTLEPGIYPIRVLQKQLGYANLTASLQDVRVTPQISTVFPSQGSACGGLTLTIFGFAFTSQSNSVRVSLGGSYSCEIKSSVYSMILCTLLPRDQSLGAWQLPEAYPVLNITVTVNGISSICLANCTLHLREEWTPSVDAVTWEINGTFTDVMLSGQRLVWATDEPVVCLGDQAPCHVTHWNETSVRCRAASVYAGEHTLSMPNSRRGQACFRRGSHIVSIAPYVLRFYPQHFGGNGGGRLTIEGAAFQGRSQPSVIIGNQPCLITRATYNVIQCTVPPGHGTKALWLEVNSLSYPLGEISYREEFTPAFLSLLPGAGLLLTVKVSRITAVESMRVSVGDSPCTDVNGNRTTLQCLAPQLPAGEYHIVGHDLLRGWASSDLTFISRLAVTSVHNNFGCLGGGAVHLHGTGLSPESTSVAICDAPCETLGPATATDLSCRAPRLDASLAILCSLKHSSEDCQGTGATYIKCDIRVTVGMYSVTGPAPYIYLCDDDILPWDHTTGDSSLPCFTGLFFSPKVERDEVLIYNSSCNITMETEAEMECEGANQPITAKITEIRKSWGQNTQRHARLRFCGPWSKSSSWLEGHPPQDGDNVTVERGQTLLLDTITGILNLLHVKGGKLLFGGPGPVGLHAHYILVSDGGKLQVGFPNAPFCCKAHIHLYGSLHTPTFFPFGAKFLAVRNGTLSIHGWVPNVMYTHLKSAAHVNDTRLVLAEPVDWQSGDEVIVSGTGPGDGERQEEIVTVEAVNNTELYLRSPLRFPHGFEEERMGGQHFSLSAVVALLSRRIVVQGNVTDERMSHLRLCAAAGISGDASGCLYKRSEKKLGSQEMGAVVMMQAFQGEESHIRLEGVQFRHVGQAFQQHLSALTIAGTARLTDSYIRGCSIWDSFGRGLRISGTSDLRVDNNVFYNISGHGLLLGGWLEQGNKIRRNILIGLSGTDGLSNLEAVSPAGIYIQAPANQIEGNMVCAAGDGYFFHLSPKGPSRMPVLSFSKNIAHSCTRYGLLVYPEYQPQHANGLGPVLFQSFMAWRNQGGAQIFRSSNLELQNFQIHSCKEFGIDIVESLGNTSVTNSLLLGHLGHKNGSCMSAGLKTPKRRELLVSNTSFMNFDSSMCTAISTCSGCSRGQGGFTVRAEWLKFLNSPNRVLFPFPHSAILEDLDGSITEQKGSHLLASLNILATSCVVSANFSQDAASSVCGKDVIFHRMSIGLKEAPDAPYNLTVTDNNNKTTTVNYVSDTLSNLYGWMALLLDKEAYTLTFDNPLFNKQLQYSATFDNFADGNYLLMEHRNLSSNIEVTVLCGTRWGQPLQSLPSHIYHKSCDWFFSRKLGTLTYLVTGEDLIQVTFKEEERVSIPTRAPSDGILKWSMPESWSGVGRGWGGYNHSIPAPGEDVIILPNRAILVDTTLPPLRGLYVMGRLEFPVNSSNVLSAACVVVAGGELKVGTFHHPLERGLNLLIFLRASDGIYCDRLDGINVYPGTIGVYGKVQIHSAYPKKSWTHLGADIAPGNERILLADEVDWSHGGNIVISSSSYEPHQAEVVTVKEIRNHSIKIHERLLHRHIGRSHNTEDGRQLPLAAEVGLLTRSIQIKSDTVCAGRLLVGRFRNANGVEYAGALQLLNVELLNFGPSHLPAIDFRNVSQGSAVIASSIHQTCGGGIQSVASHGIVLRDNVMFSTVGPGIDLEGQNHSLTRNLIILSKQPEGSPNWVAGIKVNLIDGAYLLGNVVAGSERIAFHIKGQECSLARDQYIENVAHSSLHGVHLYRGDGFQNCTRITGFLSYKNYDYGVMFHLESSVVMDNMMLVDNAVGVLAVVVRRSFEQHSLRKEYIKFRTSVIVATSKTFDCIKDRIKPLSGDSTSRDRAPRYPQRGRIGILWPAFASDTSRWPDEPWHKIRNDPSVLGIMKLQEVTFTGFTKSCYSDDMDICIMSNPDSTGIMHPITSEKMRMLHVNEKNKLYFHMLQASSNEYEDTVFPEIRCESSRKALFKDLDGSALGLEPPVSAFPKSDLEWPQFYLHAGIYREDSKCVYKPSTQGYFCKETDHALLILESLEVDADGERPSPVVSVTGSFVDSFNAAASHSSCCSSGYPWSFYSVLPSNKLTKVCFAGPTPLTMRLHLISGQSFTRLFLAVFYNEPQSVHVFTQGKYIPSTSSFLSSDAVAGTNYFSFEDNLLYVLLHGDEPVEIYTSLSLLIAFTTATTIGEEEQKNVIPHLADFLQIGHELVRIVHNGAGSKSTLKVIAANARKRRRLCPTVTSCMAFSSRDEWENTWAGPTSMRRLRPSGTAPSSSMMIIEVGDPPSLVRNSLVPSLSNERLKSLANLLITAHQTGELQHVLDIPTDTLMLMWPASPSPEGSSGRNGSGLTPGSSLYARPYNISVQAQPSDGEMGKELPVQPQIIFLDKQGQRVETLGLPTEPWVIAAYLKGSSKAALKGHTTVEVQHGRACFTDLAVSNSGIDWYLVFTVSSPPGAKFTVESQPFTIFPIAMGEKSNPILTVVLSSVASVIVLGLFIFCWVKKSKSNKTKTGRANAPQAESNIKPSLIHRPNNSAHVPLQRKQGENDRDVAGVEADMEANGKQGCRVGEVKEQHPQAFKAKSLGKMNIVEHKMDSGEKSSVAKKCGDRYEPCAMTSPWDSFELQQLGLKELSEWKDGSQE